MKVTRRSPYRDCRDGAWSQWGPNRPWPRRSAERLQEDGWWRMTASYRETWI